MIEELKDEHSYIEFKMQIGSNIAKIPFKERSAIISEAILGVIAVALQELSEKEKEELPPYRIAIAAEIVDENSVDGQNFLAEREACDCEGCKGEDEDS